MCTCLARVIFWISLHIPHSKIIKFQCIFSMLLLTTSDIQQSSVLLCNLIARFSLTHAALVHIHQDYLNIKQKDVSTNSTLQFDRCSLSLLSQNFIKFSIISRQSCRSTSTPIFLRRRWWRLCFPHTKVWSRAPESCIRNPIPSGSCCTDCSKKVI